MKKSWVMLGSVVLGMSLVGCGTANDNATEGNQNGNQQVQSNQGARILNNDQQDRMPTIADRAEKKVEEMEEIEDAHVFIYKNNAYVSVKFADDQNQGARDRNNGDNAGNANNVDENGNAIVNDALDGNGRTIMDNGTVKPNRENGSDGVIDGKGDAGNGKGTNNQLGTDQNTRGNADGSTKDKANNRIMNDGDGGTADNQNQSGELAQGRNNYKPVSNKFEQKIADQVRQANNKIHDVYVSLSPNSYTTMGEYADDIRNNRNQDGFFEGFNEMINDLFPRRNG
ncbi:YhcN/YlaJ family sporulation lipoprotein [Mesobacillus maritimus]|uniref:YhcN/YlaJ family sporulation lipoprotein n=1 Tax=Mesobacillus maritimus TaxID=1643336 RepID=UPI002041A7A0|nr:YhcN/YlaJ family sporulation lipoprotein [Mesobacillus maritimus]MCM3587385.1 YhcN/YlaJ family sporulation lipoprotein [Mesobacillus maritimus]MCM3667945.1 YhcN/YlaJ family sporulation lipoprotein [Mesobacillus maritimus]